MAESVSSSSHASHMGRYGEYAGVLEAHIAELVLGSEVRIYSSVGGSNEAPSVVGVPGGKPVLSVLHKAESVHYDAHLCLPSEICL